MSKYNYHVEGYNHAIEDVRRELNRMKSDTQASLADVTLVLTMLPPNASAHDKVPYSVRKRGLQASLATLDNVLRFVDKCSSSVHVQSKPEADLT